MVTEAGVTQCFQQTLNVLQSCSHIWTKI